MTHLGDDVRAQAQVARRLAAQLHEQSRSTRRRVAETHWDSTAGDHFHAALENFTTQLNYCARDIDELAESIDIHADSVERAEEARDRAVAVMLAPIVAAPGMIADGLSRVSSQVTGSHTDQDRTIRTAGGWL